MSKAWPMDRFEKEYEAYKNMISISRETAEEQTSSHIKMALNSIYGVSSIERGYHMNCDVRKYIKNVKFNPPATIVFWTDNTKTVVKCKGEDYDPEKGLAMCICKKVLGNKGNYYNVFRKWLPEEDTRSDVFSNFKLSDFCKPTSFTFKAIINDVADVFKNLTTPDGAYQISFTEVDENEKNKPCCLTCAFYDEDKKCVNRTVCLGFDKWTPKDE